MTPANVALALQMLDGLLARAQKVGTMISTAQKEGRDLSAAEIDGLFSEDSAARAALQVEIDRQRAGAA